MTRKIKVLQLQVRYNPNSTSDLSEQIIRALPKEKYEVTTAFLTGQPGPDDVKSQAEHSVFFDLSKKETKHHSFRPLQKVYTLCLEEKYDVVIAHRFKPIKMIMLLNKCLKIPLCIGIIHAFGEFDNFFRRFRFRHLIDPSWRFVGVSPAVTQYLIDCNCGFNRKNTITIANAIDVIKIKKLQFPRTKARLQLGLNPRARIIGTIGRLVHTKGHQYLLQAFAQIKDKYPEVQLSIIGAGPEEKNLKSEIKKLGLEGRAHLLGYHKNAVQYVRGFDIWTMPSLSEAFGIALLEGMIGELPVIVSDVPGMSQLAKEAGGIVVDPGNVDALINALDKYLILTESELKNKGKQAYQYVEANHNINVFRQNYLKLIEESLGESQHPLYPNNPFSDFLR
ncbi:MAG: glycosyltransferase family 4 protein [Desulfobacteraceae bacterium]|nr:glycosyltransferase family 4 protein [Desulfobacteraceae bacterium]